MRLGIIAESPDEQLALDSDSFPAVIVEVLISMALARVLLVAVKLGILDLLAERPATYDEVASELDLDPEAAHQLLLCLARSGYASQSDDRFSVTPRGRWGTAGADNSLKDVILGMEFLEFEWLGHLETYVRTGRSVSVHEGLTGDLWGFYQKQMRSYAAMSAARVAELIPVPENARRMLDIGGSHGYQSVEVCRRHPGLSSTILDLPQAVEHAAPLLEREGMGDRVTYWQGSVLEVDLGHESYDLVYTGNLLHHFDDATTEDVIRKVARALAPGGVFVIGGSMGTPDDDQVGAIEQLIYALISHGIRPPERIGSWLENAGLVPQETIPTGLGSILQPAVKPTG